MCFSTRTLHYSRSANFNVHHSSQKIEKESHMDYGKIQIDYRMELQRGEYFQSLGQDILVNSTNYKMDNLKREGSIGL